VVTSQSDVLISNGMKADTVTVLENAFAAITAKSNEQTSLQQQEKHLLLRIKGCIRNCTLISAKWQNWGKLYSRESRKLQNIRSKI
jgi:hypothetical protein